MQPTRVPLLQHIDELHHSSNEPPSHISLCTQGREEEAGEEMCGSPVVAQLIVRATRGVVLKSAVGHEMTTPRVLTQVHTSKKHDQKKLCFDLTTTKCEYVPRK